MPIIVDEQDSFEKALEKINSEIAGRRNYGVRSETLPTTNKAHKLVWSNNQASWYVSPVNAEIHCSDGEEIENLVKQSNESRKICDLDIHSRMFGKGAEASQKLRQLQDEGKTTCRFIPSSHQCLDANEITVIGVPKRLLESIVPLLNELPLYRGSFEARTRGQFSLKGISIAPPLKEAWLKSMTTGQPLDIQSQIAIEEKVEED